MSDVHGVAGPRRGKADVIVVDGCGAAVEYLILGVTNKPQPRIGAIRDVCKCAMQIRRVVRRNDQLTVLKLDIRNAAPGGIVNLGYRFFQIVRAQLRLVRTTPEEDRRTRIPPRCGD